MQPLAIVPQQQFNYTTGKNAADITLVIDAMDLMHRRHLDGFCLVSSDSDFTRLASRLREEGAAVYGFGAKKTPEAFRNACTRFIYIENLLEPELEEPAADTSGKRAAAKKEPPSKAVPLIRKAMEQAWDDEEWVNLGVVGQRLSHLRTGLRPAHLWPRQPDRRRREDRQVRHRAAARTRGPDQAEVTEAQERKRPAPQARAASNCARSPGQPSAASNSGRAWNRSATRP